MNARITSAVQNSQNDDVEVLDQKIDEIRKSTQHGSMNLTIDSGIDSRVFS